MLKAKLNDFAVLESLKSNVDCVYNTVKELLSSEDPEHAAFKKLVNWMLKGDVPLSMLVESCYSVAETDSKVLLMLLNDLKAGMLGQNGYTFLSIYQSGVLVRSMVVLHAIMEEDLANICLAESGISNPIPSYILESHHISTEDYSSVDRFITDATTAYQNRKHRELEQRSDNAISCGLHSVWLLHIYELSNMGEAKLDWTTAFATKDMAMAWAELYGYKLVETPMNDRDAVLESVLIRTKLVD